MPAANSSELRLAAALAAGDESAFRELVDRLDAPLHRMARIYAPEPIVEEIVQETWIAVIEGIGRFEGRSTLRTWAFGILIRIARRRAARERRSIPFATNPEPGDTHESVVNLDRLDHPELGRGFWAASPAWARDPSDDLLAGEVRRVVAEAIAALPGARREVITLRDVEGWSSEEVCDLLGVSAVNQRTLLHRARATVRAAVEEYLDE